MIHQGGYNVGSARGFVARTAFFVELSYVSMLRIED